MGWGSKIFRFLGFLFSVGTHQNELVKDDPGDRMDGSGFNDNEVNLAVGLSLSEQHQLATQEIDTPRGTGSEPVNEEVELAVAVSPLEQDQLVTEKTETQRENGSFNIKFPPCDLVGYGVQPTENRIEEYEILDINSPPCTCSGCNRSIEHGICVRRSAFFWHSECFRCHSCKKAVTDDFKVSNKKRLYHKSCYKVRRTPCFVCKDRPPPNAAGHFSHRKHYFWGEKYCPSHEVDGTAVCCGCERMEPKDVEYLKLDDGRKLCLECFELRTMDTIDSQSLNLDVREFFEDLNMKIEPEIPLYLVERQALNHGHRDVVETRGVCLSEVQTVVNGRRRAGDKAGKGIAGFVRRHEFTAILILYGLPRSLTGSILAHELMHAWFKLNGFKNLKPYVEEGICQVLAHMWLVSTTFSGDDTASSSSAVVSKKDKQSDFEKKLVELFKRQIEINPSPDYGHGFRKAIQSVTSYGLAQTLTYIKFNNEFP